jgi:SP family general alpha glucoside:H+ symporter-like MFS transporter
MFKGGAFSRDSPQRVPDTCTTRHEETFLYYSALRPRRYQRQCSTQSMPPVPTRKPVAKACDACRRRKVKCNGFQPCVGCSYANLACTFDAPRGQGGNRGARATILNELRAKSQNNHTPTAASQPSSVLVEPASPVLADSDLVGNCMDAYKAYIYPVVPLLDASLIEAQATRKDSSLPARHFVQAFCAYVSNFGRISSSSEGRFAATFTEDTGKHLLDAAIYSQTLFIGPSATALSVYTSFFLYGACAGRGDYQRAWYYLREATTCFLMLRPKYDGWYDEKAQRCLFWVLVVSERYLFNIA